MPHSITMESKSILVINPNSTTSMTDSLKPVIANLCSRDTGLTFFTAPRCSPRSINNAADVLSSASACLPSLVPLLPQHDGFLVACYSSHPLVWQLRAQTEKPVVGIFEASVTTALHILRNGDEKFGIVSTGQVWEDLLSAGVLDALGVGPGGSVARFAGVETTGLNATDLHEASADEVRRRMVDATRRLLRKGARVVCLGCAGMAGMDKLVREACVEELGEVDGRGVRIIDGVKAGVALLDGLIGSI